MLCVSRYAGDGWVPHGVCRTVRGTGDCVHHLEEEYVISLLEPLNRFGRKLSGVKSIGLGRYLVR